MECGTARGDALGGRDFLLDGRRGGAERELMVVEMWSGVVRGGGGGDSVGVCRASMSHSSFHLPPSSATNFLRSSIGTSTCSFGHVVPFGGSHLFMRLK
mgnify:CR=1 FL=1